MSCFLYYLNFKSDLKSGSSKNELKFGQKDEENEKKYTLAAFVF